MPYFTLVLHGAALFVCITTYWKAGDMEDPSGYLTAILWSALSAVLFVTAWRVLDWGWLAIIATQVGLGVGIALLRTGRYMYQTREKS